MKKCENCGKKAELDRDTKLCLNCFYAKDKHVIKEVKINDDGNKKTEGTNS